MPLKRISIMLSISALFSCSFMRKSVHRTNQTPHMYYCELCFLKGHFPHLCDLPSYLLKMQWAFLPRCLCLLHIVQFVTVFNADMEAQSHAHEGAHQLQC